jgi:hypothetical protein
MNNPAFVLIYIFIICNNFFISLHHPAARQFCRSTYTITDIINTYIKIEGYNTEAGFIFRYVGIFLLIIIYLGLLR